MNKFGMFEYNKENELIHETILSLRNHMRSNLSDQIEWKLFKLIERSFATGLREPLFRQFMGLYNHIHNELQDTMWSPLGIK